MAEVKVEGEVDAPLDAVWKLVSDFRGFVESQGLAVTVEGEGIGTRRTVEMGASKFVERLEALDEETHSTSYSIVDGPLPATGYVATIALSASDASRTHVTWSSHFEPAPGHGEEELAEMVSRIYEGGIKGLQRYFGA
ncbi:MAG: SRPBCC family protein [Acidimicrobiales bacterium]